MAQVCRYAAAKKTDDNKKDCGCIAAWMVMFAGYKNSGTNERNWTKQTKWNERRNEAKRSERECNGV